MPRLNSNSAFYFATKSNDTSGDRYISFGSHANYLLNTGGISIWVKRGTWRNDGENILELIQFGTSYVRVAFNGAAITLSAYANAGTIASATYTLSSPSLETWRNIVVTWDSSSMIVYLDKTAVITVSGDKRLSFSANPTFYVGTGNAVGSGFMFDGYVTRAALYNAKLSTSDIEQIWNTRSPSSEQVAWDFTDGSSSVTVTRGTGNSGSLVAHTWVNDVPVRPRRKIVNQPYSIAFDGTTTKIVTSSATPTNFGTGDFTLACDVFRTDISTADSIFNNFTGTTGIYWQFETSSNSIRAYLGNVTLRLTVTQVGAQILNKWVRLYLVKSSDTLSMYMDGVLIGSATGVSADNCSGRAYALGDTNMFVGLLSKFRAWNRALSSAEIMNEYCNVLPISSLTSGLVAELLMTEGSGTSIADTSGQSNNGTLTTGSGGWNSTNTPMKTRNQLSGRTQVSGRVQV